MSSQAKRGTGLFSLVVLLLCFLVSLPLVRAQKAPQSVSTPELSHDEQQRLLDMGKKIFVQRCSNCHGERGDKPLATGLPLSERKLEDAELSSTVGGRLKNAPEQEKRAVTLYIKSFRKKD